MKIQLVRHATVLVTMGGKQLLVDPMLGKAGVMPPIDNSPNDQRNPLVELTIQMDFGHKIDGVLLTHTHRDHFDEAAIEQIPPQMPILCQPADEERLQKLGFLQVCPIQDEFTWSGITIQRTGGQHGTGEIALQMAPVSGYILKAAGEPSLYITGDTIYCEEVTAALVTYQPPVILVNAGGAQFNSGDPITMTAEDVVRVCRQIPHAHIIAVHMDAINHCNVSRFDLRTHIEKEGLLQQVAIPVDGEMLTF